jgi:hypothetical protein
MIQKRRKPKIPSYPLNAEGHFLLPIRNLNIIAPRKTRSTVLDIEHPNRFASLFFGKRSALADLNRIPERHSREKVRNPGFCHTGLVEARPHIHEGFFLNLRPAQGDGLGFLAKPSITG